MGALKAGVGASKAAVGASKAGVGAFKAGLGAGVYDLKPVGALLKLINFY